jgi:hypothetical protein
MESSDAFSGSPGLRAIHGCKPAAQPWDDQRAMVRQQKRAADGCPDGVPGWMG